MTDDAESRAWRSEMRKTAEAEEAMLKTIYQPARFGDEQTEADRAAIERLSAL
ncbi:hypothetical protein [Microbacterium testaceum]|uniref:hypothetical protein n=1 Tax=Microbacterium testaceum TaxID=2033 RepID=UPI00382E3184